MQKQLNEIKTKGYAMRYTYTHTHSFFIFNVDSLPKKSESNNLFKENNFKWRTHFDIKFMDCGPLIELARGILHVSNWTEHLNGKKNEFE